jgi:eukaryotic-like serine/threonine-protein kinase
MHRLKHLIAEAHRRSLWQVLGVYLLASWAVVELVETLTGVWGLPDWIPPFAFILLLVGLPIVLATAVVQEGGPRAPGRGPLEAAGPVPGTTDSPASGLKPPDRDEVPSSLRPFLQRHLTWPRAIGGGVAAFAVLGLLVGGYFLSWSLGIGPVGSLLAAGELEEGDWIVVADFDAPADDPDLGTAVSDLLRIDFAEHPVLRVPDRTELRPTLERMQVDPDGVLTADLAREVALREGMTAVLEGEVSRLGTGYVVSATLRSAESGESLASMRETAADEDELISATERLSERARERAGESLPSIRAGPGLAQVSTSSLDALRLFSEGDRALDRGDHWLAIELLEEAVERDPEFAMAWRRLAVALQNAGVDRPRQREAYGKAYELRHRLTDRERYHVEANYHWAVERDREASARALRRVLEVDPYDRIALHNLALIASSRQDYDLAVELLERAVGLPNPAVVNLGNLILVHLARGGVEEARAVLEGLSDLYPGSPIEPRHRFRVKVHEGDEVGARSVLEEALEDPSLSAPLRSEFHRDLGRLYLWRGRLEEARAEFDASERAAAEVGDRLRWVRRLEALVSELLAGDPDRAVRALLDAQDDPSVAALAPEDRLYGWRIAVLGTAGRTAEAESVLQEWEAEVTPDARDPDVQLEMDAWRALIVLREGRPGEAVERVESVRSAERCPRCYPWLMGWALWEEGRLEDAVEEWEYAATPAETTGGSLYLPSYLWTIRKLAPLYEELGETERAVHYYRRLIDLWEDADPELQPQVEHARQRIAALDLSATAAGRDQP